LKEAMEKYPGDPQVAFEAALDKNLSPEEQRRWLNAFEKSAPDNALANYLSALNCFNSSQIDQGVRELTAASGKQQFQDFTLNRWKDDEEACLSTGYSAAEAAYLSTSQFPPPKLAPVKQLGKDLVDLANVYSQSGDQTSAQATLQMAVKLGQRYVPSSAGEAVLDQLNQIAQQRAALKALMEQATSLLETMSDQVWTNYTDRWMIFGEQAANQWLVNKYGQK
jgi:hypothetical protein